MGYDSHRDAAGRRQRAAASSGRDIGQIPSPLNSERRRGCGDSFRLFCETYLADRFPLAWSDDHLRVLGIVEETATRGGRFAFAMPRGSGKTTIVEAAILWAALYGRRRYPVILGVSEDAAAQLLESVKVALQTNEELAADFPEVCLPVRALEGLANRCKGQTHNGQRTFIEWGKAHIVLPTIEGSVSSAVRIDAAGLLGRIRGRKFTPPTGEIVRPDFVAIDDPQTDLTAKSDQQIRDRLRVISSTVLGMAGPGKEVAAFMPCTVIRRDDVAHQLLDRKKFPGWRGITMKLMASMPDAAALELWERYGEIRRNELAADRGPAVANAFYLEHRDAMDRGAVASWAVRKLDDEISAIQHGMNRFLDDPEKFASEDQNEPLRVDASAGELTADDVANRCNNYPRGIVPDEAHYLTAFVDVQGDLLFWVVVAWGESFTGWIVDYGAYPEQPRRNFTLRAARPKLGDKHGGGNLEAALFGGLNQLAADLLARPWKRANGSELRVGLAMVDANWGQSTNTVYLFAKSSPLGAVLLPSHGKYVGASSEPIGKRKKKHGDRMGQEWFIPAAFGRQVRHVIFDSNYWKSFVAARLAVPLGARGALTLYGDRPDRHELFAAHVVAEYRVRVEGRGRQVDEWKIRPNRPDNHWLDCLVGCAVAASVAGVTMPESAAAVAPRKTVSFKELQAQARARKNGE